MFDPDAYGPVIATLLRDRPLLPLARPQPNLAMREQLNAFTPESLLPVQLVCELDMASACLAGLWLAHGFLDESHAISQEIEGSTGSYWHGILHRLEPDFANSKYWFRRVGRHPIFETLQSEAASLASAAGSELMRAQEAWDPFAFVDLCQECIERGSTADWVCRAIQRCEWELLFDFCYRAAIGDRL